MKKAIEALFVLAMVAMLVLGSVSLVLANPDSQKWYLTDTSYTGTLAQDIGGDAASHNCDDIMSKTEPSGDDMEQPIYYDMGFRVAWWYAENPAACDLSFGSGNWPVYVDYRNNTPYSSTLYIQIYKVDSSGNYTALTEQYAAAELATGGVGSSTFTLTGNADQSLNEGERLAVRFRWNQGGYFHIRYNGGEGSGYNTYIQSPEADPGYPTPELPTIILMSVGLLGLGGYVWFKRRNPRATGK